MLRVGQKILSLFLALAFGLLLIGSTYHWTTSRAPSEDQIASTSLSSKARVKSRKLILNKVKKTKKKSGESAVIMADPAMSQKWGLHKTDVQRAWNVSQGSHDIVIAVIDTGIDVKHPDIRNNLWVNKGETGKDAKGRDRATNGLDDDQNGCTDDVFGCDFITNSGNLKDNHGHGTHIAGIIGAEGGNGIGISGVAPKVRLMILKYYDPKAVGANNLLNTVRAIKYALAMKKAHGIKKMIINYSGGGLEFSRDEYTALEAARRAGVLVVAAAGNEHSNSDKSKYFPASYDLSNIISVTAVNPRTEVLASSNYGVQTVDIAAPGENIYSTLPNNSYGLMTGTSQATAFVTGVATLVMAHHRDFSAEQVKKYILRTGDDVPTLKNMTGTSKRLNSYRSLVTLDQGVGAMGTVAMNTINMKVGQFASDPQAQRKPMNASGEMAIFSRDLLKVMQKVQQP